MKDLLSIDKQLSTKEKLEQLKNVEMNKSMAVQAIVLANVVKDLEKQAKDYLAKNYEVFSRIIDDSSGFAVKKVDRVNKIYNNEELDKLVAKEKKIKKQISDLKKTLQEKGEYSEQMSFYHQIDKSQ